MPHETHACPDQQVLSELKGKTVADVIEAGREKLASVPSGAPAAAGAAPAAGGAAAAAAPAPEPEPESESEEDMGFGERWLPPAPLLASPALWASAVVSPPPGVANAVPSCVLCLQVSSIKFSVPGSGRPLPCSRTVPFVLAAALDRQYSRLNAPLPHRRDHGLCCLVSQGAR